MRAALGVTFAALGGFYIYHTGGLPGLCQQPNRPHVVSATSKLKAQQNIAEIGRGPDRDAGWHLLPN